MFSDQKKDLSKVSREEWEALPISQDLVKQSKKKKNEA